MKVDHKPLFVALGLIAIVLGIISLSPGNAQTTATSIPLAMPHQVASDSTPVLSEKANLRSLLELIGERKSGGFLAKDYEYGALHAFVSDGDRGEINVFRYDTEDNQFFQLDCSSVPFDSETPNIFDGILKGSGDITTLAFLNYYHCSDYLIEDELDYDEADITLGRSIRSNVIETQSNVKTIIAQQSLNVTQSNQLSLLQQSADDIYPKSFFINGNPDRTIVSLSSGKGSSPEYATGAVKEIVPSAPKLFILQEIAGTNGHAPLPAPKYLVAVWRLAQNSTKTDYTKIGVQAFLLDEASFPTLWDKILPGEDVKILTTEGETAPLPMGGIPIEQLVMIPSGDTVRITLANATQNANRGNIAVTIETHSDGSLQQVSFDVSEDSTFAKSNTLRVRFSPATVNYLTSLSAFQDAKVDTSKLYTPDRVTMELSYPDKPTIPFEIATGTPASGGPYLKASSTIKPGKYVLKITMKGYKRIEKAIDVTSGDLSISNDAVVLASDIKTIDFQDLTPDPCVVCNSILSCLACVDWGMIQNYSPVNKAN